jgi:choline dehydrogenase-like flavoprotein
MQTLAYKTVIVGSGIAGRTVASHLEPGTFVVVERGEDRDYGEMLKRFDSKLRETGDFHVAENHAYGSDMPWNIRPQLSRWNYSKYAMVRGGASNWWGGNTRRCSPETFTKDGPISWILSYNDLLPWYKQAEQRLNICGDVKNPQEAAPTPMPGAEYWRSAYAPYFTGTYLSNVALNKSATAKSQGLCKGRSQCTICREDAKARPDNIFEEHHGLYESMALQLDFDGELARSVECYDGKQIFNIDFDRIVIAANGIETPRLLARSNLPLAVRRQAIGRFYQDHGHMEIWCKIDKPLLYGNVGGLAHVHLPQISKYYSTPLGEIEISAFALTHEPPPAALKAGMNVDLLRSSGAGDFFRDLQGCFCIFCELEIPPQAEFRVDLESDNPRIIDENYPTVVQAFDDVLRQVCKRLTLLGVTVLGVDPKYRVGYNSHHLTGTMNCSAGENAVVDNDMRVIGTENVFIAGSSVMPRAGGHGPTLTIAALAERLGAHLAAL